MPRNSRAGKRTSASAQRELESPERKKVCLPPGETAVPAGRDAEHQRAPHRKEGASSGDGGASEISPASVSGSTSGGDRSGCGTLSGSAGFDVAANEHKSTIAAPAPLSGIPASSAAAAHALTSSSPASVQSAYAHPSRNSGNPQSRIENAALLLPAPGVGTSSGRAGVDSSSDALMSHASRWQLVTPRLHSIRGFGRGAEVRGGSLSSANAAPARESVAEGGFGRGAEARGISLSSANAAPARESVAEVRFSRLGSSISTGPLATWVDSVMSAAMLLGVVIVCNNFLSLIFFFVLYNHLCDANVDMIKVFAPRVSLAVSTHALVSLNLHCSDINTALHTRIACPWRFVTCGLRQLHFGRESKRVRVRALTIGYRAANARREQLEMCLAYRIPLPSRHAFSLRVVYGRCDAASCRS